MLDTEGTQLATTSGKVRDSYRALTLQKGNLVRDRYENGRPAEEFRRYLAQTRRRSTGIGFQYRAIGCAFQGRNSARVWSRLPWEARNPQD